MGGHQPLPQVSSEGQVQLPIAVGEATPAGQALLSSLLAADEGDSQDVRC